VRNRYLSVLILIVLNSNFAMPVFAATPKENSDCTSVNKIVSVGKTRLICAEIVTGTKWIKVISISSKLTQIKLQANQMVKALSNTDTSTVTSFLAKGISLQQSFDQKNKEWRDAEFSLNTFKTEKFAAENELKNLPASISQASSLVSQSQAALAAPQQTYTSLLSQLNAMSSEYSSAYSAKSAYLTCRVLNDFGFQAGGCGYYNSYYDVVISRYNSMQSQVNGARATYDSYYASYTNNFQRYKDLLNSQNALNSKISDLGQKLTQSLAAFTAIDAQLKLMTEEKEIFDVVLSNSNFYFSEPVDLSNEIQQVLAGSSKTWTKKLAPLYQRYQVFKYDVNLMASRL
jgi:chromosome segregation ATPase